ncbi:MAG: pre-mycofactocin synthase MftD [Ilumatobacteraceae bacterium]
MSDSWFETIEEARRRAERRLPRSVYKALVAGAEKGVTLADNVDAFDELGFAPRVASVASKRDLTTTVLGRTSSMPVLISPTGVQAVDPEGEVAVARAASSRNILMGLSSFASRSVEDVVEANPATLLQLYWIGDREAMSERIERARTAGAIGLIITLDWTFTHARDWGSPTIPQTLDFASMLRFAPEVMRRPRWLAAYARVGRLPDLAAPNMAVAGDPAPTFFQAYADWMGTPPPSWSDLEWLVNRWDGPIMLKGITRADDARRAVDVGMTSISVSNHGGNNLDGTPATIRLLPAIVEAVGNDIEVLIDGGIRRGSDVVKALALGARAVMIGRAYLWGLAANGQAGVENVLDLLRAGLDSALLGLGRESIDQLEPSDVMVPDGFLRDPLSTT